VTEEQLEPDAEQYQVGPTVYGGPVDQEPHVKPTLYANVVAGDTANRRPILAAEWRNPEQRRQMVKYAAGTAGYHAAFHATRTPKYLAKVLLYSPIGAVRGLWRVAVWTFDLHSWSIRQHAASRNAVDDYLALSRHRDQRVSRRLWATGPAAAVLLVAVLALVFLAPRWALWLTLGAAAVPLAWLGRPKDKPILDRVVVGERFTRLTAEMVRAALLSLRIQGLREAGDVTFAQPGIHRDGPGWLARVNLPHGLEAAGIIEKRGALSSALRLPVDQVWPGPGPDHAGQLDLWVGYLPSSKMGAPRWALASPSARASVFDGYPVGHDERLRPINFTPFQRNVLIGGQPGSGKTFGARAIVLGALLDPTAEVWLAAFKASEDFYDVSKFCTRYACGVDDATMDDAVQMVADGLREVQRRQTLLGKLKREGKITEGRTNAQLAAAGIGLHPLVLVFDEVHELFLESKPAVADMIRLLKLGRSAGVFVVNATQVAGKDAVPPEITRVTSSRWCMSVSDQVANDQIMGTGAYKRGLSGTAYRPEVDAGWGATTGLAGTYVGPVRAYYPNEHDLAVMLRRIAQLRGAGGNSTSLEPEAPERDVVADVLRVWAYIGRPGVHWQALVQLLAREYPEVYGRHTADSLSALLRAAGLPSVDVKDADGVVRKGVRRVDLQAALESRETPEVTDGSE